MFGKAVIIFSLLFSTLFANDKLLLNLESLVCKSKEAVASMHEALVYDNSEMVEHLLINKECTNFDYALEATPLLSDVLIIQEKTRKVYLVDIANEKYWVLLELETNDEQIK